MWGFCISQRKKIYLLVHISEEFIIFSYYFPIIFSRRAGGKMTRDTIYDSLLGYIAHLFGNTEGVRGHPEKVDSKVMCACLEMEIDNECKGRWVS